MSRPLDDRDVGISAAAKTALGALFGDDPDAELPPVTRHFVLPKSKHASKWEPSYSACGLKGIEPNTRGGSTSESSVSCEACKAKLAESHAAEDGRSLRSLAKSPGHRSKFYGARRERLIAAGLAEVRGDYVVLTDAGRGQAKGPKKASPRARLTREQQRRVRELVEDEGQTRAEAVAYVEAFEPAEVAS